MVSQKVSHVWELTLVNDNPPAPLTKVFASGSLLVNWIHKDMEVIFFSPQDIIWITSLFFLSVSTILQIH